jgi:hypothetical protein
MTVDSLSPWRERAGRIWTDPRVEQTIMDTDLAEVIAEALRDEYDRGKAEDWRAHYLHTILEMYNGTALSIRETFIQNLGDMLAPLKEELPPRGDIECELVVPGAHDRNQVTHLLDVALAVWHHFEHAKVATCPHVDLVLSEEQQDMEDELMGMLHDALVKFAPAGKGLDDMCACHDKPEPPAQTPAPVSLDDLETAWGIIANAYGGDWDSAPEEWRAAAMRFRARWHELLAEKAELLEGSTGPGGETSAGNTEREADPE